LCADNHHIYTSLFIQDLLLPEERIHQADYLIDLSRDRIQVYNVRTLKKANLAGLHTHFDDYYDDFDVSANLNSRSVGEVIFYHGYRAKSEQQQKNQVIYYRYLDQD